MKAKPRKTIVGANVQAIWQNQQPQFGLKNAFNTNHTELISALGFSSMERERGGGGSLVYFHTSYCQIFLDLYFFLGIFHFEPILQLLY